MMPPLQMIFLAFCADTLALLSPQSQTQPQPKRKVVKSHLKGSASSRYSMKINPGRGARNSIAECYADGSQFFFDIIHADLNNILISCANIDYNSGVTRNLVTRHQYAALMGATNCGLSTSTSTRRRWSTLRLAKSCTCAENSCCWGQRQNSGMSIGLKTVEIISNHM